MDILDLPSISDDDELDYEPADGIESGPDPKEAADKPKQQTIETSNTSDARQDKEGNVENTASAASSLPKQSSRKRKQLESLRNSDVSESDHDEDDDSCHGSSDGEEDQEEDAQEFVIDLPGRLAGRVKRITNQSKQTEEDAEDGENVGAERFAQILAGKEQDQRNLKDNELEKLYASLDADPDDQHLRFNALFVTGAVDKMTTYDISRIFAQFDPENVRSLEHNAFIVIFANALVAAEMLLEMSKPMRRVRTPKKPEEGELMESSEEDEGQVKEEDGEDVSIVRGTDEKRGRLLRSDSDVVEVDVETIKVPPGKWRVITQHVPDNKLIFVRFASGFELRHSVYIAREEEPQESLFQRTKVRPGLNVFDEKGNELDWDYEHDTRFFDNLDWEEKKAEEAGGSGTAEATQQVETEIAGIKIRSRGRGTKKFLQAFKDSSDDE